MADKPTSINGVSAESDGETENTNGVESIETGTYDHARVGTNLDAGLAGQTNPQSHGDNMANADLEPPEWQAPFLLRYRIPVIVGSIVTVLWSYLVYDFVELQ